VENKSAKPTDHQENMIPIVESPTVANPPHVNQSQTQSQPQIQYVNITNQKSLDGLSGWLIFWLMAFSVGGISFITAFFSTVFSLDMMNTSIGVVTAIFALPLAITYLLSVVLIALHKKFAITTSISAFVITTLYISINIIVAAAEASSYEESNIGITIGTIITTIVVNGLFALYFMVSKRVKQTLIVK